MSNTNCLEGIACPKCQSDEPFEIVAMASFRVYDDGTEINQGCEWDDDSAIDCIECQHRGIVSEFRV